MGRHEEVLHGHLQIRHVRQLLPRLGDGQPVFPCQLEGPGPGGCVRHVGDGIHLDGDLWRARLVQHLPPSGGDAARAGDGFHVEVAYRVNTLLSPQLSGF